MSDNFAAGEVDSDQGAPPIETMGARYGISEIQPASQGRGEHEPQQEPYLMPSVHGRNGSMERVDPAITLTPLGGMMPGPFAIAPAIPDVSDYRAPVPDEAHPFDEGIVDGYPEGAPFPY